MLLLLCVLCGFVSGLLSGLLGVGGGVVTVPALYFIFHSSGFPQEEVMRIAMGTSLATTFITTTVSSWAHWRKKSIVFSAIQVITPGLLIGCIAGALLAHDLPNEWLRKFFGVMSILMGAYFFFPRLPRPEFSPRSNFTLFFFGILIGSLSSLLGIGGGSFAVPILLGFHLSLKDSIGTSAAATLLTAFFGSISYMVINWNQTTSPDTFGSIEVPVFLALCVGSVIAAPLGVKLAHNLNTSLIKRIFACTLSLTGLSMLLF